MRVIENILSKYDFIGKKILKNSKNVISLFLQDIQKFISYGTYCDSSIQIHYKASYLFAK